MSWVNDLASTLGIPAGAATLAVAMYAACAAAEKAARPEALQDIGRVLQDDSWERSVRPSAIIERLFNLTFGERHLSWKCVGRSLLATIAITIASFWVFRGAISTSLLGLFYGIVSEGIFSSETIDFIVSVILIGFVADYISLGKARWVIGLASNLRELGRVICLVSDIVLSCVISVIMSVLTNFVTDRTWLRGLVGVDLAGSAVDNVQTLLEAFSGHSAGIYVAFFISTMFTSVWALLIILSTTLLKIIMPIQRFTAWFFNVDEHPVEAIGIVSGAMVMLGSLIWAVLRAVV